MTDRIENPWGAPSPYAAGEAWPVRVDTSLKAGVTEADVDRWVKSACVLCSNGCGLDIAVKDDRMVGVRGRAEDRVSHGRLGPKGLFGWQANEAKDRLTRPLLRRGKDFEETDWDTALGVVTERAKELLKSKGAGALGIYNTGQLFLEEYYTLAVIAKAGLGTPHLDGNTRLCTATAAAALRETFAMDGQPASYRDVDFADTLLEVGHNVAETQTVLWTRMRDRLHGSDRPRLVVVDPRVTVAAREADVHLDVKPGMNLPLLNALLHELVKHDWIDRRYIEEHTVGFDKLAKTVEKYPPERAAKLCGVDAGRIREAARILGEAKRLLSSVLQGVYQSHQATAAAVQVNNINLVRGMLGKPGCGILQMNGQPTAENTRETGCDGEFSGFRNFQNQGHIEQLARIWNVDPAVIPHWASPTHAMQIFRLAESGSLRFLWIMATNPAVSLPELSRIRSILRQERLMVVVQDAFMTETARLADVVLPAALWGEKTGTYTNSDRTVHLSDKAVEPPGEARSDLDILLDFARRMKLTDKDGAPLIKWSDAEGAFEAWKVCSKGRPCDYSGMSYEMLRERGGVQWPCNEEHPDGKERLYDDGRFYADPDYCQEFGHDLSTGAHNEEVHYRAMNAGGKAMLREAEYEPPHEDTSDAFPFGLTTGRNVYHFHTRTKTGRAPELQNAAPAVWFEINADDAARLKISEGDLCRVESPRGFLEAPARLTDIKVGVVFVPFHYGYWDEERAGPDGVRHAANELTLTSWDPVSKQPTYKTAAVRVQKLR